MSEMKSLQASIDALNAAVGTDERYYQLGGSGILMLTTRTLTPAEGITQVHQIVKQGTEEELAQWIAERLPEPVVAEPEPEVTGPSKK